MEIGNRIFHVSTAGEYVDGVGERQVKKKKKKLFDGILVLTPQNFLTETGF